MSNGNDQGSRPSGPHLPFQDRLARGETVNVDGTNVVRVPFGVRTSRRERPQRPENWHTLVLPLQRMLEFEWRRSPFRALLLSLSK